MSKQPFELATSSCACSKCPAPVTTTAYTLRVYLKKYTQFTAEN
jgi:hypothetical protein